MNIKIFYYGIILILILSSISVNAMYLQKSTNINRELISNSNIIENTYVIVDTGLNICFDNSNEVICPNYGESFYGQDAQYYGKYPSYQNNGDGTITDLNTGLMWQKDPGEKMTYNEAVSGASSFNLAGYDDWRLPSIKELYSLIDFRGTDPSAGVSSGMIPFINTDYFDFEYGDPSSDDRIIDSQWTTSSVYESTVMDGQEGFFGVNFADGRIKCYPTSDNKLYFTIYVRGDIYGINDFVDNGDGTISDISTGLIWQKNDNGEGILWEEALSYSENLEFGGYNDWRLPNAKELQSIIDYSRSPDTTNSAAIDPIFGINSIINEGGEEDYPFFWTSTTHIAYPDNGFAAVYISFGRALGYWNGHWIDVHGAGAQRSDPKTGDPNDYPFGHGPQGDAVRIYNYVRCVRGELSDNQAPNKPNTPDGPGSGQPGIEYTYSSSTSDPDGDQLYYLFDWGDGTDSGWKGPFNSGEAISESHSWDSRGNYEIRVKAKDDSDVESQWSNSLPINMPKNKSFIITNLWIFRLIKNIF
jgi:hypothetical protein